MWRVPENLWITTGMAEGETPLNAFDNALLAAGIGNLNLIKVSSICPKNARITERKPEFEAGTLVPAVFTSVGSGVQGEEISCAIGIGIGRGTYGVMMEHAHVGPLDVTEKVVREMVEGAFRRRGLPLEEVVVRSCHYRVERIGCVVAAVLMW